MTGPDMRKGRPRQDDPSFLADQSLAPAEALDELARHVDGAFVVVVKATGGKYRRRCFLSSASAERAAARATAAGHNVVVYLAELKPLWRLIKGQS